MERFVQISTDEVYGSHRRWLVHRGIACSTPRNPYAASKAGGDRLAYAYWATYGVPVIITRASNNYGPYQYPEKLIPLFVTNALRRPAAAALRRRPQRARLAARARPLPRRSVRRSSTGTPGEVYNIAGGNERENIEITPRILAAARQARDADPAVADRSGHDRRYSLDAAQARARSAGARSGLRRGAPGDGALVRRERGWWQPIKDHDGDFREYYERQYGERLKG